VCFGVDVRAIENEILLMFELSRIEEGFIVWSESRLQLDLWGAFMISLILSFSYIKAFFSELNFL
jgi:hypothetical protein